MQKTVLVGAGGKMGCRITDNLSSHSAYSMSYVEINPEGQKRLADRGLEVTEPAVVIPMAEIVILAVPDIYIGEVTGSLMPLIQPGTIVVTLDPAAAVGGHLPKRDDITYFVSHPCHPSVFNWEADIKNHFDYFGGITAHQAIVCALVQGPGEHYALGEQLAMAMYAPVNRSHRITVQQMAILEPGLAETFLGAVMFTMREAMDEVIKMGVPKDAVFDFFMGHINIDLALLFSQIPGGVFSDACYKAIHIGRPLIFKENWKDILKEEHVAYQVAEMTKV